MRSGGRRVSGKREDTGLSTITKDAAYGRLREGGLRPNARKNLKVAAFMAPILIFALLFVYYPFLKTLVNSLCAVNDKGEILRFAGLENFKYVFGRNDFKKALRNSIVITLINVPVTLVLTISLALLATSAIVPMTAAAAEEKEVTKPEKITIMVDTTLVNQANGRDAFEARWEELTGIDLVINQPDHSAYYDVMQQTMADPDQWPDVLIMSSTYYSDFAANGALWDMTEAWENSNTKNSGRFTGDSVIEGLKINGRLYGFSPARGNGCVTYVKKAWMDKAGITKAPTNWEEYAAMLDAFSKLGVDGKTTYGTSAAGFIGNEAPYTNYLPEFYQDAYPSFILKDGVYVDGFTQPEMEAALARLKEGYDKGWIDPTTLTNSTKDCRNKFYDEQFGAFTYWAGTWATNLKTNLEANGHDSELIALPPIAEVGAYFDRIPPVWCITSTCENPEGVFAYFIDTMLDGGDMQMLWTYGAEGTHWSRAAETVLDKTYEEGTFHFLENLEKAGTLYTKNHIDPMLSLASFAEGYPDPKSVKEEARAASELFNANSKLAAIVPTTEEMGEYGAELTQKKNELIANVIMGKLTYEQAMEQFESEGYAAQSQEIVDSLNALLNK